MKKKKIIISISVIFLILMLILGLTYAYFRTRVIGNSGETSIEVLSKVLAIKYNDGTSTINMEGSIEPGFKYTKTFNIENTGDESVTYALYLDDVLNEYTRTQDWEMEITCSPNCSGTNGVVNYPELSEMIVENEIASGVTQTYNVEINYLESKENQSIDMGAIIRGKFQIYSANDTIDIEGTVTDYEDGDYVQINSIEKKSQIVDGKYRLPAVEVGSHRIRLFGKTGTTKMDTNITIQKGSSAGISGTTVTITDDSRSVTANLSSSGLVLYAVTSNEISGRLLKDVIIENATSVKNGTRLGNTDTTPAQMVSNENEKVLATAEDDEGTQTSYYFRGSVQDNYVEFKGMCFRIVRIEGDGAIKLIFAGNGKCTATTSDSGTIGLAKYGHVDSVNIGVDYKGYTGSDGLRNKLLAWLNNNFTNAEKTQYLKEDKWCLGGGTTYYDIEGEPNGYNYDCLYISAKRLFGLGIEPYATFKCSNEEEYDINYVGTLTADETVYAGAKFSRPANENEKNTSFYLYEQASSWLTLTLFSTYEVNGLDNPEIFAFSDGSNISHSMQKECDNEEYEESRGWEVCENKSEYARPVITLKSGIPYNSGEGTRNNPYIIN